MSDLKEKIEELIEQKAPNFKIAKLIREELKSYNQNLPQKFKESKGVGFLFKHTRKIDEIIKLCYYVATREMFGEYFPTKTVIPLTITALGSYGREQLSPKSDIDIMFVYKDVPGYNVKNIIEKMYYLLLDSGLKLGHRVHEIDELEDVAESDITIKTAILESRFVDGSKYLWYQIQNHLGHIRYKNQQEFILAKIEERRKFRAKYPIMMEPNLKEGVGGFRDANLVLWIGKLLYNVPRIEDLPKEIVAPEDYKKFSISLKFLFKVRAALHLILKNKNDQLRLDYIPAVMELLNYPDKPESQIKFSRRVIKSLRTIWLYSRIWIDALISKADDIQIDIYTGYLKPENEYKNLEEIIKFLIENANKPFRIHPKLHLMMLHAKKVKSEKRLNRLVLKAFETDYTSSILTAFSEVKMLKYFIKPMQHPEALPQFDGYHKYSVDTHSIKAVEALENITDSRLKTIYNSLSEDKKRLLKLVAFLHDAGKGKKEDHHKRGEYLFKKYGKNLGLPEEDIKIGANLILHHSKMSITAQKEDIYSHKVVAKFTALFPTKLELNMILLLTYADTTAVGSNIYNELTARLFKSLYDNAMEFLIHRNFLDEAIQRARREESIKRSRKFTALPKKIQRKILNIESNLPFIKYTTARIIEIAVRADKIDTFEYEVTNKKFLTIEIIKKIPLDLGYLLSKLSNINLVNMDIIKLFDGKKYFKIDFNEKVTEDDVKDIKRIIEESFTKQERIQLPKPTIYREDIEIDCEHSSHYALMRFTADDQKGLLAYLMNIFEEYGIEIVSAKVYTHKNKVDDMFLIERNGKYCINLDKICKQFAQEC